MNISARWQRCIQLTESCLFLEVGANYALWTPSPDSGYVCRCFHEIGYEFIFRFISSRRVGCRLSRLVGR